MTAAELIEQLQRVSPDAAVMLSLGSHLNEIGRCVVPIIHAQAASSDTADKKVIFLLAILNEE